MIRKTLAVTLAAATLAATAIAPITTAEARNGRHGAFAAGAAAGIVGGAIIGSQLNRPAYAQPEPYYDEPRRCVVRQERYQNDYGEMVTRSVRTCR